MLKQLIQSCGLSRDSLLPVVVQVEGGEGGERAEMLVVSSSGLMSRTAVSSIPVRAGNHSIGVRVIRLGDDDSVATVTVLPATADNADGGAELAETLPGE